MNKNPRLDIERDAHKFLRMRHVFPCLLLALLPAPVWGKDQDEEVGDRFRITLFHKSESKGGNGSSSSNSGGHEYREKILAFRDDGVERLYDIPLEPDDERRLISWQFPVRVFEGSDGSMEILNRSELEKRRDAWLNAADIPKEACGTWYFTWNAFQVECDPDDILKTIKALKIQPKNLIEGAVYEHDAAIAPGRLQANVGANHTYRVNMEVNPDYFHRAEANSDVAVGEIMRQPISFEEAYAKRKAEQISGSIEVVLKANAEGRVGAQITSVKTMKAEADGNIEHTLSTETIERRKI